MAKNLCCFAVTAALGVCLQSARASTFYAQAAQSPYQGSGTTPSGSFATGDFNGDTRPDLFLADSAGTYRVFLGQGDGTFARVGTLDPSTEGTTPFAATVGRFNSDGYDDVAIGHLNSPGVSVLLSNGNGTFTKAPGSPILTVGGNVRSLASGQVNDDAFLDLVFVSTTGNLYVLRGDGSGGFTATVSSPLALGAAAQMTVGAVDSGNTDDIVVVFDTPGRVRTYLSNAAGALTPGPSGDVATGTNYGSTPRIADLNHDGFGDIVVGHSSNTDNVVSVTLGSATGALSAAPGSPYVAGGVGPYLTAAPALFSSDADLDVVVSLTQSAQLSVMQGDGTGRLTLMQGMPIAAAATSPQNVVSADFNADGTRDFAYIVSNTNPSLHVMLGRRAVMTDVSALDFGPVSLGATASEQAITLTNAAPFAVTLGDTMLSGANASDFATSSDTCTGQSIPSGATCSLRVSFSPLASGARTATLSLRQDGDALTVALAGGQSSSGCSCSAFGTDTAALYPFLVLLAFAQRRRR